jgi:hypothetical protein
VLGTKTQLSNIVIIGITAKELEKKGTSCGDNKHAECRYLHSTGTEKGLCGRYFQEAGLSMDKRWKSIERLGEFHYFYQFFKTGLIAVFRNDYSHFACTVNLQMAVVFFYNTTDKAKK